MPSPTDSTKLPIEPCSVHVIDDARRAAAQRRRDVEVQHQLVWAVCKYPKATIEAIVSAIETDSEAPACPASQCGPMDKGVPPLRDETGIVVSIARDGCNPHGR
jgi:hypothetical protein